MLEKIKSLSKNSIETNELNITISKLPENKEICRDVLDNILMKKEVKVKVDEDFKGNYYNGVTNEITLSGKEKQETHISRPMVVCHECIHATQSKVLHYINYIGSNLEVLLFVITLISIFIFKNIDILLIIYNIIGITIIIIRTILELQAIYKAIPLSNIYMKQYIDDESRYLVIKRYKTMIIIMMLPFFIGLLFAKILRLCLLNILNVFI